MKIQARRQTGALGATAPSVAPVAPSGLSLCTLCTKTFKYLALLLPCLVVFVINGTQFYTVWGLGLTTGQ